MGLCGGGFVCFVVMVVVWAADGFCVGVMVATRVGVVEA